MQLYVQVAARLTDGRSALHIAAAYNRVDIATALLRRSKANAAEAEAAAAGECRRACRLFPLSLRQRAGLPVFADFRPILPRTFTGCL
jgi:hypothetical protein